VFGNNQTGLVTTSGGTTSIVGGVHTEYLKGILTASSAVTGAYTTAGIYTWPEEKWEAWNSYMATRTAADVPVASATGDGVVPTVSRSGSGRSTMESQRWALGVGVLLGTAMVLLRLF
jgi:carboxypeptidase D